MCLVLALTNMKKVKLNQCLNDIGNTLLKSEDDGFGYAVQGRDGVFGEKTINKRFRTRLNRINFVSLPIVKQKYEMFGKPTELTGPGIFHGRTSTNVISLIDTHPMQIDGWNLIHNGVVDDLGPFYTKATDNDSEDVLRRLLDGLNKTNPMEDIEKYLRGYYAFAAIDPQGRLHICRDDIAPLHIAWSAKLETFIIGTTEGLILKVSKILDAKIGPIDEIDNETYCIFSGNELIHCQDFKAMGYTPRQAALAQQSLHRDLPTAPVKSAADSAEVFTRLPGGDIQARDVTPERTFNELSEADWQAGVHEYLKNKDDSIMDFLKTERHPDRVRRGNLSEEVYYKYKNELDNMDASYQIYQADDRPITLNEFRKLDHISQELCTIIRADGTVVDPECYETPRLRGRHAGGGE